MTGGEAPGAAFLRCARRADDGAADRASAAPTCFVILNLYPYNNGHLMVVPNRHVATLAAATRRGAGELIELTRRAEIALTEAYAPHGINMGINLGKPAGAGMLDHLHMHVVPRWNGDTNFMTVVGGDARAAGGAAADRRAGCDRSSRGWRPRVRRWRGSLLDRETVIPHASDHRAARRSSRRTRAIRPSR